MAGKSAIHNSERQWGAAVKVAKKPTPRCQEKPLGNARAVPVPQTDTGRQGENPKARERTLVKELGKLAP
jgi:hypothetical protein